jgi:sugar phosphate isomerase/epimerase
MTGDTAEGLSWAVFTKPWPELSVDELAATVARLGFDSVEFPLRDGFQVAPGDAERGLPALADRLGAHGLRIHSVAGPTEERVFAACAAAGVGILRIMIPVRERGYLAAEANARRLLDALLPWCERYRVKVAIQPHHGRFVSDAAGLRRIIEPYPAEYVGAIWDAAHDALAGQQPELGLELLWSHLCMVNLKNAYYRSDNGPEVSPASWRPYFTTGPHGLSSWPRVAAYLMRRGYPGPVCLTAQYTAADQVESLVAEDLRYARGLFRPDR